MSNDLINKKEALDLLRKRSQQLVGIYGDLGGAVSGAARLIDELPSADRPQGEWKSVKASIYPYGYDVECSVCGHRMGSSFGYKFCPMCGASMKGADDE